MKISIIITIYNSEKYLVRCLDSVINQTYHDLEIILVNDGSTDESATICNEYALKDSRVKVIHKENGGVSTARNAGVKHSTGDFIAFVDSDDWVEYDMFEYLIGLSNDNDADISSLKYKTVTKEGQSVLKSNNVVNVFLDNRVEHYLNSMFNASELETGLCNKIYRRKLFSDVIFPENQIYEDMYTILILILNANKWVASDKIGYYYFQKTDSITHSEFSLKNYDLITVCEQIENKVKSLQDKSLYDIALAVKGKYYLSLLIKITLSNADDVDRIRQIRSTMRAVSKNVNNSQISIVQKIMYNVSLLSFGSFKIIVKMTYRIYKRV